MANEVVALRNGLMIEYRVFFNGRICSPSWQQKGPAKSYLDALEAGTRQPEYAVEEDSGMNVYGRSNFLQGRASRRRRH